MEICITCGAFKMSLNWPNEQPERRLRDQSSCDAFLDEHLGLPDREQAISLLPQKWLPLWRDPKAMAALIGQAAPQIATRLAVEQPGEYLRTIDGLLTQKAIDQMTRAPSLEALQMLGLCSGSALGRRMVTRALGDAPIRARITNLMLAAFQQPPMLLGSPEQGAELLNALQTARTEWSYRENRTLDAIHRSRHAAVDHTCISPLHLLIGPLIDAAPQEAFELIDQMLSPLDAALIFEFVDRSDYAAWIKAIEVAPAAWDHTGWVGRKTQASRGLALPFLLHQAAQNLNRLPPDSPIPTDIAKAIRNRADGPIVSLEWCALLLEHADRDHRAGQDTSNQGQWLTAKALATKGGWNEFDAGRGPDALLKDAAQRLAAGPEAQSQPPRLLEMLPATPEAFLDNKSGRDLSRATFKLHSSNTGYGLVTRILSTALLGSDGPARLQCLWDRALILRDLANGAVKPDSADDRNPNDPLCFIVALGIGAVELIRQGEHGDAAGLLGVCHDMLAELEVWQPLGHHQLRTMANALSAPSEL